MRVRAVSIEGELASESAFEAFVELALLRHHAWPTRWRYGQRMSLRPSNVECMYYPVLAAAF